MTTTYGKGFWKEKDHLYTICFMAVIYYLLLKIRAFKWEQLDMECVDY